MWIAQDLEVARATRTSGQEPPVTPAVIDRMVSLRRLHERKTGHYEKLRDLRQPTLLVSGDRHLFFPFRNIWMLYRELANAQLLSYPSSGHGPHQQHPEEVAEKIEYFLATT